MEIKRCSKCGEEKLFSEFWEGSTQCSECKKSHTNRFNRVCRYCGVHFKGRKDAKNCSLKCSSKVKGIILIANSCTGYKTCRECGELKKIVYFNRRSSSSDGFNGICRDCVIISKKSWDNRKEVKVKTAEYNRIYKSENIFNIKAQRKEYRNSKHGKDVTNSRRRAKYRENVAYNLRCKMASRMHRVMRGGEKAGRSWKSLVGYSVDDLIRRLKETIPIGYGWGDFLNGSLQIDHIIPIAAFNFKSTNDIDFKRCWDLNNLQLLPALENQIKNAKLEAPFQPSMAFGGKL
jgi:hypothetical protein